ncbi:hypothetical protein D3C86_1266150 [compost metagenome]
MAGGGNRDLLRLDEAPRRLDTSDGAIGIATNGGDRAVLDDIDPTGGSAARIPPGDGVVARSAGTFLKRTAHDRITRIRHNAERRAIFLAFFRGEPAIVHTVQTVGMDMTLEALHIVHIMRQHQHAAP